MSVLGELLEDKRERTIVGNCEKCGRFCRGYLHQDWEGVWDVSAECATGKGCKKEQANE